jgi:hypothetical protein
VVVFERVRFFLFDALIYIDENPRNWQSVHCDFIAGDRTLPKMRICIGASCLGKSRFMWKSQRQAAASMRRKCAASASLKIACGIDSPRFQRVTING